jgi:hypothetical protein
VSPAAQQVLRSLDAVRRRIEQQSTNYLGQEGRSGARGFQLEALRTIDRQINAVIKADTLAASMRRGVRSANRLSSSAIEGQADSHRPDAGMAPSEPDQLS